MNTKEPVLLTILIETARMRWLAGGIGLDSHAFPLLASQDGDLAEYSNMEFDEQTSFLRHRFCGALQRGCDRLWGLQKKACQFVFLTDRVFPDASPELTERVSQHLVQWMTNPPVVFFSVEGRSFDVRPVELTSLAGEISAELLDVLKPGLPRLFEVVPQSEQWEPVPAAKPRSS